MTSTSATSGYRQHIIAAIRIAGHQLVEITTHGGGPGAEGSYITAAFGQQLMITMYDLAAAQVYIQAWTADEDQWIFNLLPATVPASAGEANIGPALSVRAYGHDRGDARYDQATRCALVRVGSLTWSVQDQAAADSMRGAWQYLARAGSGRPGSASEHPAPLSATPPRPPASPHLGAGGRCRVSTLPPIHPHHDDDLDTPLAHHPASRSPRHECPPARGSPITSTKGNFDIMYTITTSPGGRTDTADTIPHALAALVNQLTTGLPDGPVTWSITDPNGDEHRGREYLNGRLELLQEAVDQLADELYTETSPICRRGTTRHRPLEKKNPSRNYHRQPGQRTVGQLRWVMPCRRHGGSSGQYLPRLKRVSPGTSFAARRPCWWRRKR